MTLTKEQERVLLYKHLTGEFPGQKWSTVQSLLDKGMVQSAPDTGRITLTDAGKAYCDVHHATMPASGVRSIVDEEDNFDDLLRPRQMTIAERYGTIDIK